MAINEHLTEFAGLPVVEFLSPEIERERLLNAQYRAQCSGRPIPDRLEPDKTYAAALADPGTAAWRLRVLVDAEEPFEQYFARFLAEVDTTKVTALIVGCWGDSYEDTAQEPRDLLISHVDRFPALRSLFLGEFVQEESEISWIQQTDVTPLLAAFPRLEELVVRGGDDLEFPATRHGSLRRLTVQTGGLPHRVTTGILASDLPALEHLELWFGTSWYGRTITVDDLVPLLAGERFPALRSLGLRNSPCGDDLVRALAEAPVLDRVRVLDLSSNVLTDAGGEVLATAPVFRTLDRLVLHYHFLTEEMEERLRAALPGVDLHVSKRQEPKVYEDRISYYPEVTE